MKNFSKKAAAAKAMVNKKAEAEMKKKVKASRAAKERRNKVKRDRRRAETPEEARARLRPKLSGGMQNVGCVVNRRRSPCGSQKRK